LTGTARFLLFLSCNPRKAILTIPPPFFPPGQLRLRFWFFVQFIPRRSSRFFSVQIALWPSLSFFFPPSTPSPVSPHPFSPLCSRPFFCPCPSCSSKEGPFPSFQELFCPPRQFFFNFRGHFRWIFNSFFPPLVFPPFSFSLSLLDPSLLIFCHTWSFFPTELLTQGPPTLISAPPLSCVPFFFFLFPPCSPKMSTSPVIHRPPPCARRTVSLVFFFPFFPLFYKLR